MTTYPLRDRLTREDCERLGVEGGGPGNGYRARKGGHWITARAVRTEEFRSPQAGEWFLSGAVPEAYRANRPLCGTYRIARLVAARKVTAWEVVE